MASVMTEQQILEAVARADMFICTALGWVALLIPPVARTLLMFLAWRGPPGKVERQPSMNERRRKSP